MFCLTGIRFRQGESKMAVKKIRIGHVGTLHDHSLGKLSCIRKYPDIFEIVGIAENDPAQRKRIEHTFPYCEYPIMTEDELLERGCDCVLVEGFEYDLPHIAKRFLEQGVAVHIDKPAGIDIGAFEDTLKIAKKKQLPVQMAYMYRYNPAVQKCISMIEEGKLGEIRSITAIMNTGHPRDKQQWLHRFEGGIMFFLGCHMVDLIYRIQGVPEKVTPYLHSEVIDGISAVNQATAILEYKSGISIAQANACEINGYGRRQLVVCGTKGTYELRPLERKPHVFYTGVQDAVTFQDRHSEILFDMVPDECRYDDMMLDFAKMVRGEMQNPYSYEYEFQLQKILLACCAVESDYRTAL